MIGRFVTTNDYNIHRSGQYGFTLIELVMVIILLSILSFVFVLIINGPIKMWSTLGARAELTASAESALQRISRESRLALPNSVRVSNSGNCSATLATPCAVEFLRIIEGGRYRAYPPPLADQLDFTGNADQFAVLGGVDASAQADIDASGSNSSDCMNGNSDCLVVYNTGSPVAVPGIGGDSHNAYLGPGNPGSGIASSDYYGNIASVSSVSATHVAFNNSDLANWHFSTSSPSQRFYIVDTPVSFICNLATGQITRHQNYPISATQSNSPGGTSNLLVDHVTACDFSYNAAASTRNSLVTMHVQLASDDGELVSLLQQAHISNLP